MAKLKGEKSTKATLCKIKTEYNGYFLTDTDKILMEIVIEKLTLDLDALFKSMDLQQINSSCLDSYVPKKELLKSLIFSNDQMSDLHLNQIENQIVRVILKIYSNLKFN